MTGKDHRMKTGNRPSAQSTNSSQRDKIAVVRSERPSVNPWDERTPLAGDAADGLSRRTFLRKVGSTVAVASVGMSAAGVGLLASRRADAGTVQRPLSDFLNAQGTKSFPSLFGPIPVFFFTPGAGDPGAWIDYAGLAAPFLAGRGLSLGTSISGSVTERPLADGRAEVTVLLQTANALAWVQDLTSGAPLFGSLPGEIAAGSGRNALAVGESFAQFVFDNTAPGAPLPDLIAAVIFGEPPPGFQGLTQSFRGRATGPLRPAFGVPQGTPGELVVSQTGLLATAPKTNPNSRVALDAFPAELVDLHRIG
jgi:hypothetical protein